MEIKLHSSFKQSYKKRIKQNPKLVRQVGERIALFQKNPSHSLLKNHQLRGDKKDFRSFSITGDIRIVYKSVNDTEVMFLDIGTHNQVY